MLILLFNFLQPIFYFLREVIALAHFTVETTCNGWFIQWIWWLINAFLLRCLRLGSLQHILFVIFLGNSLLLIQLLPDTFLHISPMFFSILMTLLFNLFNCDLFVIECHPPPLIEAPWLDLLLLLELLVLLVRSFLVLFLLIQYWLA